MPRINRMVAPSTNGRHTAPSLPPPPLPLSVADVLRLLHPPGSVVEIRALKVEIREGWRTTKSGFFDYDHFDEAGAEAPKIAPFAHGMYVMLNTLKRAILSRRYNKIAAVSDSDCAKDGDVERRRFLLIDSDPEREGGITGIPATDAEKRAAWETTAAVLHHLTSVGWPSPIQADSGNGYHLLYRIDVPADDGGLVQRCLAALAERFNSDQVKIDRSVYNPARITKLYGTLVCKGDKTPDRPHRTSAILSVPADIQPVPLEKLEALAGEVPERPTVISQSNGNGHSKRLNVPKWLTHYGQQFHTKTTDSKGRTCYVLAQCPFDHTHGKPDSCIFQDADGALSAKCFHNSCAGHGWQDFKARIGNPLPEHYDAPANGKFIGFPIAVPLSALQADDDELDWLWKGFISARGITLLSALWKAGKTTLLAHLLRAMGLPIPTGKPHGIAGCWARPALCGREVKPGTVLYVTEESKRNWIQRRDGLGIGDHVHVIIRPFRAKPDWKTWEAWIENIGKQTLAINAQLIVLDTISSLWPVRNENDAPEVQAALMPLWNIAEHAGILTSHHLKKGDGAEGTGSRGSGALPGFVDTIMELRRYDASKNDCRKRVIRAYGRDEDTPPEIVIELDANTNKYVAHGDRKGARIEEIKRALSKLLQAEPSGMTLDEIKEVWTDDEFPRKNAMLKILSEGTEQGDWIRAGAGKKGDPFRYSPAPVSA